MSEQGPKNNNFDIKYAGNVAYHKTVLMREVLEYLNPQPGGVYVDATFGGGGHTRAILMHQPECRVIAIDLDQKAIENNAPALEQEFGDRFKVLWGNFGLINKLLKKEGIERVDGFLADFGTSQHQILQGEGFSFQKDSLLDMRMSNSHTHVTAAHILNTYKPEELEEIFFQYGQEPLSRRMVQAIVKERVVKPFKTTFDLVRVIERIISPVAFKAKHGIHPATRIFQALRIVVNNEFAHIHSFLNATIPFLVSGSRVVCISFHSLEDRMVKYFFQDRSDVFEVLTKSPVKAKSDELDFNPSSRSAKLRVARRF